MSILDASIGGKEGLIASTLYRKTSLRRCFAVQGQLQTHCQQTRDHQRHPAPTAIKTQTLSKRVSCSAYQSARQRNMGIANKSCQGFGQLFGEGRLFGRPLFKQTLRNYHPWCIYLKQLLNNTKNVSIKQTLSITILAQYFHPATSEEHPINNHDPDRVLFWKTCNEHLELTREAVPFAHPDGVILGAMLLTVLSRINS